MTDLDALLCQALKKVGPLMHIADEDRHLSTGRYRHAIETDLKGALRRVVEPLAHDAGLCLEQIERPIEPKEWPRVGPVDFVFTRFQAGQRSSSAAAFVELKWARTDALWIVAWDLVKSALVTRLGLTARALCIVGALDSERATRYGALLAPGSYDMRQFLCGFHSALKPFCFREPNDEHPTGPYCLPDYMEVTVLCEHAMHLRALPWTLSVMDVHAPGNEWVTLNEHGQPATG